MPVLKKIAATIPTENETTKITNAQLKKSNVFNLLEPNTAVVDTYFL